MITFSLFHTQHLLYKHYIVLNFSHNIFAEYTVIHYTVASSSLNRIEPSFAGRDPSMPRQIHIFNTDLFKLGLHLTELQFTETCDM